MNKFVYDFSTKNSDGDENLNELLGNKGANLAAMCKIGIPVPPGFTITTKACTNYFENNFNLSDEVKAQIATSLKKVEEDLDFKLGDNEKPLLLSVRSGAKISMPGMMDTILNLGLNDVTVKALAKITNNERFAYDCYRRFIQMYASVVLEIDHFVFEDLLELAKQDANAKEDSDLSVSELKNLIDEYKILIKKNIKKDFPENVKDQLDAAIKAVFNSWNNPRAVSYRKIHNFPDNLGTAVNIQSMVFGNLDNDSATGVAFTRDPSNGDKYIYGEYLINAQGEDVVAGIRTPQVISLSVKQNPGVSFDPLEKYMPSLYKDLVNIFDKLEKHYRDMQDVEFTIQQGKIWILQTRSGKRSAKASIKIAVDLVKEGFITEKEALLQINPILVEKLLHPTIDLSKKYKILTKGLPAAPGAATGKICFTTEEAERISLTDKVILVRHETSPEDINGMNIAEGILTTKGGMTSHAAVVARGMGKSCVCGASEIIINYNEQKLYIGEHVLKSGDVITINGSNGEVILGEVKMILPELSEDYHLIMKWAHKYKRMSVRANSETNIDAKMAREFGAEGIGLCRTEHMFFKADRINSVREMILSEDLYSRQKALDKLLDMQIQDFVEIFKIMQNFPVNIRLLDPPLHEFLPHSQNEIKDLAKNLEIDFSKINNRIECLKEQNPMLGHRGCRIGISYPEIYEMQANAIFKAMEIVYKDISVSPKIEIMVPLVITEAEFLITKKIIDDAALKILGKDIKKYNFIIGTMIELPRACFMAGKIANHAAFFSFGTNDLTQTTLGLSRDDSASFLTTYINQNVFAIDPFVELDEEGVGELIKIAISNGKKTNPKLKIGICGEHGGNPNSIKFFNSVGLDYVSCSPYRVPIAIIAAAQSSILSC